MTLTTTRRGGVAQLNLHDYQKVAISHLHQNPRAALFLDMGLGKTAIALRALTPEHLPVLVTAPKRVAENVWAAEVAKWRPDLTVCVAAGRPDQRRALLDMPSDITVIGRDNLRDVLHSSARWRTFVLDELSGFKSRSSVRWRTARSIIRQFSPKYVWGLTGTPSPNGLLDLWAQIALLDEGARLGKNITAFRSRYFVPGRQLRSGVITEWLLRPGADKRIHQLLEDICLSMESDGRIELPPVTYNPIEITLPPAVRRTYRELRDTLVADLDLFGGEIHSAQNAAVLSSKLSQLTAGFLYVDDQDLRDGKYDVIHREKLRAVYEVIEGTGSPILVFYRFRAEKEMLTRLLPDLVHPIDEPGVIDAWNRGEIPILLAHPAAAGHGLNLQHGGHTIVWMSLPWSLEEWEQGNKRINRQGQTHPVVIHTLITPRTIDGVIKERLETKTSVQDALLRHLESPL